MKFRLRTDAAAAGELLPSRVPAGAELTGSLSGIVDLTVVGRFVGDIEATGVVTVRAGAEVEGTVHARAVVVAGKVTGPVVADERIEIVAGGSVAGDVTSPHVVIADGADLHGTVDVLR